LNISQALRNRTRDEFDISGQRECSKKSVQQGRSPFDARSVHSVREHGKRARTPLVAFFNIPIYELQPFTVAIKIISRLSHPNDHRFFYKTLLSPPVTTHT
jgi:hypothetical protein